MPKKRRAKAAAPNLRACIVAAIDTPVPPITTLPDPNCGISAGRRMRHNLCEGSYRIVRRTNPEGRPAHRQFVGEYARNEIEVPFGTLLLKRTPEAGVHLLIVTPGIGLATVTSAKSPTPTMRRIADEVLADPASEIERQVAEAMLAADGARDQLSELGPARKTLLTEKGRAAYEERELRRKLNETVERFERIAEAIEGRA